MARRVRRKVGALSAGAGTVVKEVRVMEEVGAPVEFDPVGQGPVEVGVVVDAHPLRHAVPDGIPLCAVKRGSCELMLSKDAAIKMEGVILTGVEGMNRPRPVQ